MNVGECQCSLAVEHPLSKREVVGSNPAIGFIFVSAWVSQQIPVMHLGILGMAQGAAWPNG